MLLLRRLNTGYADGQYSVPAGHLDGNETVVAAAIREAQEEIGVTIAVADLTVVGVMHRRAGDERIDFFTAATCWTGDPHNCEPAKCDNLLWADPDHLPANVIPYVRRALENYSAGRWFDTFGWPE